MIARKLPGLPPYGEPAKNFPDPDAFREGLVVEFTPSTGERWIGNFATGGKRLDGVHDDLGEAAVVVVSGGDVYLVDARERHVALVTPWVKTLRFEPDLGLFVLVDDCEVTALGRSGIKWRSRRVSWDGITEVHRDGSVLKGLAHYPQELPPAPFEIDLMTGEATGGSY
ncbi:MAG: hypothetical protein J7521_21005 [Caulobacter sp.]|nr:hypothetical protein [Caulobacter sp.]